MDNNEQFIQQFIQAGKSRGYSDEEIKSKLTPALQEFSGGSGSLQNTELNLNLGAPTPVDIGSILEQKKQRQFNLVNYPLETARKGIEFGEYLGSGMSELAGMPDTRYDQREREALPDWVRKMTYEPEEAIEKFGKETAGERFKAGFTEGAKRSADIGSWFVKTGLPDIMVKEMTPAFTNILNASLQSGTEASLREFGREGSTVGSIITHGTVSGLSSGLLASGGEAMKWTGKELMGEKIPEKLATGAVKPDKKSLQINETRAYLDSKLEEATKAGVLSPQEAKKYSELLGKEVVERGDLTFTPTRLYEQTKVKGDTVGKEIEKVIKASGDKPIPVTSVLEKLDSLKNGMTELFSADELAYIDVQKAALVKEALMARGMSGDEATKILSAIKPEDLVKLSTKSGLSVTPVKLWELRKDGDDKLNRAYKMGKEMKDLSDKDFIDMNIAHSMRELLGENVDGLKQLNADYSYYKNVQSAMLPVINKEIHSSFLGDILTMAGLGIAAKVLGLPPAYSLLYMAYKGLRGETSAPANMATGTLSQFLGKNVVGKMGETASKAMQGKVVPKVVTSLTDFLTGKALGRETF